MKIILQRLLLIKCDQSLRDAFYTAVLKALFISAAINEI